MKWLLILTLLLGCGDMKDELKGDQGERGADGTDGAAGVAGNDGINGTDGRDGSNGKDGVAGVDGRDGEGCTVYNEERTLPKGKIQEWAVMNCPDGTTVEWRIR